jgi:hypothetical protein
VRIELASGWITRTPVPPLQSTGPVSFVVAPDRAVVRPLDFVAGYQVFDGRLPRSLPRVLRSGGLILPGPRPGTVWAPTLSGWALRLARLDGRTGATIRVPNGSWLTSDGSGYALASTTAGVWRVRPGGRTRISDGTLLASGPTGWLVRECEPARCTNVVIDRRRGTRRVLPGPALRASGAVGVVAPDGSAAAVFEGEAMSGTATVTMVDLRTGARRRVPVTASIAQPEGTVVWSPDSRWVFVAGDDGRLWVVDAATGEVDGLPVPLPPVEQLAVRTR